MDNEELKIKIIHEPTQAEPYIVLDKPAGLASAPLKEGDDCAYTQAELLYPFIKDVCGSKTVEHGLLHRIDTPTRGLLLVASTQDFYDYMHEKQKEGLFIKEYRAECIKTPVVSELEGFAPEDRRLAFRDVEEGFDVSSYFRPYGIRNCAVRPVTEQSGKAALKKAGSEIYTTHVRIDSGNKAVCSIKKGYRHQVRCHLAWIGYPIIGDNLYNPLYKEGQKLCFEASAFSFPDMESGEFLTYSL